MKTEKEVYRIISNESNKVEGVYSRSYHDEYDFGSIHEARDSNCHGKYKEKEKYRIARYKVTYELIDDDCDPITPEEQCDIAASLIAEQKRKQEKTTLAKQLYDKDLEDLNVCELLEVTTTYVSNVYKKAYDDFEKHKKAATHQNERGENYKQRRKYISRTKRSTR